MSCAIENNNSCSCSHENNNFNPKGEIIRLSILIAMYILSTLFYYNSGAIAVQHISLTVLAIVYIVSGFGIFKTAFSNLIGGRFFDENLLMSVATISAIIIGAYSEAVAVLLFYRTGEFLQEWAVNSSRSSIRALLELNVDYVNKVTDKGLIRTEAKDIAVGDIVEVRAGERIPLDSILIDGETILDMKALTGEVIPQAVSKGSKLIAGSINVGSVIKVEVHALYKDSYISKILSVVEGAKDKKAKTENFITTFARYYTPAVFGVSVLVAVIPPLLGLGEFSDWVYRALVVLVVSCPCALVISIPLAYFASIGAAAKLGILIKGANYIEALDNIKAVVFDKTGTLTKGEFNDIDIIISKSDITQNEFVEYLSASMIKSNHPISKAIIRGISSNVNHSDIKDYEELQGLGVKLTYRSHKIYAGNLRLMKSASIAMPDSDDNGTTVYLAVDGGYKGKVILSDVLRDDAKSSINNMKNIGIKDMMILSGDNESNVNKIATQLGINDTYSSVLPIEKADKFLEYKSKINGKVLYIGDGINDAPVLAVSDIGVSFADISSDVAIESADMVFLNPHIENIPKSIKLARRTKIIIWQNIIFALTVKLFFIILGVFGVATIYEAVFGDVGVALIALFNSMRLMKHNE